MFRDRQEIDFNEKKLEPNEKDNTNDQNKRKLIWKVEENFCGREDTSEKIQKTIQKENQFWNEIGV